MRNNRVHQCNHVHTRFDIRFDKCPVHQWIKSETGHEPMCLLYCYEKKKTGSSRGIGNASLNRYCVIFLYNATQITTSKYAFSRSRFQSHINIRPSQCPANVIVYKSYKQTMAATIAVAFSSTKVFSFRFFKKFICARANR